MIQEVFNSNSIKTLRLFCKPLALCVDPFGMGNKLYVTVAITGQASMLTKQQHDACGRLVW